jgi:hypothetical protein
MKDQRMKTKLKLKFVEKWKRNHEMNSWKNHEKENPVDEVHEKRDKMKQQIVNGNEAKTHDEEKWWLLKRK